MIWNWQQKDWPNWRYDPHALEELEQCFLFGAGRLAGAWNHLSNVDQDEVKLLVLSDEALKSSEIEGEYLDRDSVQSSLKRQFGLKSTRTAKPHETGIAELMVDVFRNFDTPLSHETLFSWHEKILRGHRDIQTIGAYRTHSEPMQVISGPMGRPKIHFEAPPSADVPKEIEGFLRWYQNTNLPILTKAGLAHLYFVSIHPFEDGNGRISRALSEKSISSQLGQASLIALSRQIEKDRKGYYNMLEANNKSMDVELWLVWFAHTAIKAQDYSLALIGHIIAKTRMLDMLRGDINERQERALIRMFESGPEGFSGGLSAKNYMSITGASTPTTTRDLNDLVNKKALHKTGERKSTRYWLNI